MSKISEVLSTIEQIKVIEEKKKSITLDNMDFNKEPKLTKLEDEKKALFTRIAEIFKDKDFSYLEVQGIPDKDLYNTIIKEIANLKKTRNLIMGNTFFPEYFKSHDQHTDSRYIAKVKPMDDCIQKFANLGQFVSLINAPDQNFIEAMKVLYNKDVDLKDVTSIGNRLMLLKDTNMVDAIYSFYDVITLANKIQGIKHDMNQYRMCSDIIIEFNMKPSLTINKLNQSRVEFDNLLNELHHLFDDNSKVNDHYSTCNNNNYIGSYEANRLNDRLTEYASLYNSLQTSTKVKDTIDSVKNDQEIKQILVKYDDLYKALLLNGEKGKYQNELKELKQTKKIFGTKKREIRIAELEKILSENTNREKQFDEKNDRVYDAYFNPLCKNLDAKGISPKQISKFETWEELSKDIRREIINVMSNMAVDGALMTTEQVISDIFFPFQLYVTIAEENMSNFNREHKVKGEIDINKAVQYINMYKNYKMLNNGTTATTITPYSEKDMADYYMVSSLLAIDKSYQELNSEKTINKTM